MFFVVVSSVSNTFSSFIRLLCGSRKKTEGKALPHAFAGAAVFCSLRRTKSPGVICARNEYECR